MQIGRLASETHSRIVCGPTRKTPPFPRNREKGICVFNVVESVTLLLQVRAMLDTAELGWL